MLTLGDQNKHDFDKRVDRDFMGVWLHLAISAIA